MTIWSWLCAAARPFAVVLGIGLVAGHALRCPATGPGWAARQATSTEALPFDVIDLTPTTVVAYRRRRRPDRPSTHQQSVGRRAHLRRAGRRRSRCASSSPTKAASSRPSSGRAPISASSASPTTARSMCPMSGSGPGRRPRPDQIEQRIVQQLGTRRRTRRSSSSSSPTAPTRSWSRAT